MKQKKALIFLASCVLIVLFEMYWLLKFQAPDVYLGVAVSAGTLLLISICYEFYLRSVRRIEWRRIISDLRHIFKELAEIHSILANIDEKNQENAFKLLKRTFGKARPSSHFMQDVEIATMALDVIQNSLENGNIREPKIVVKSLLRKVDDPIVVRYVKEYLEPTIQI